MIGNLESWQRGTDWEVTGPFLLVLSGFAGTGKTSLGKHLKVETGLIHFDVDLVRAQYDPTRSTSPPPLLEPKQELPLITLAYKQACERAEVLIETLSHAVVLSGTFSRPEFKEPLFQLILKLKQLEVPVFLIRLMTDEDEILVRFSSRLISGGGGSNVNTLDALRWSQRHFSELVGVTYIQNKQGQFNTTADSVLRILSNQIRHV